MVVRPDTEIIDHAQSEQEAVRMWHQDAFRRAGGAGRVHDACQIASVRQGTFIVLGVSPPGRSEEHTSALQSLLRISYAVSCLTKQTHRRLYADVTSIRIND